MNNGRAYHKAIVAQLNGPVRQSLAQNAMASHLVGCLSDLLGSTVAEDEQQAAWQAGVGDPVQTLLGPDGGNLPEKVSALWKADDAASSASLLSLLDREAEHWTRLEASYQALSAVGDVEQERELDPLTPEEIERFKGLLREQAGEGPDLDIVAVRALPGGFSKQTILVTLANTTSLPKEIVVRRDRAENIMGTTVKNEFELLRAVHRAGAKIPYPIALDLGEVMEFPILVSEKASGGNIGDVFRIDHPETTSPELALDLARQFALIHSIPLEALPDTLPGKAVGQRAFMRSVIEEYRTNWRQLGEVAPSIDIALEWLLETNEALPERASLVHGDARFHNFLTEGPVLTSILDWELSVINNPAQDLGFAYHHVTQFSDWAAFIAEYKAAGGPDVTEKEIDFYILWADLFVVVSLYRARAAFLGGHTDNIQVAYSGERRRQYNMHLLANRLRDLLKKYAAQA